MPEHLRAQTVPQSYLEEKGKEVIGSENEHLITSEKADIDQQMTQNLEVTFAPLEISNKTKSQKANDKSDLSFSFSQPFKYEEAKAVGHMQKCDSHEPQKTETKIEMPNLQTLDTSEEKAILQEHISNLSPSQGSQKEWLLTSSSVKKASEAFKSTPIESEQNCPKEPVESERNCPQKAQKTMENSITQSLPTEKFKELKELRRLHLMNDPRFEQLKRKLLNSSRKSIKRNASFESRRSPFPVQETQDKNFNKNKQNLLLMSKEISELMFFKEIKQHQQRKIVEETKTELYEKYHPKNEENTCSKKNPIQSHNEEAHFKSLAMPILNSTQSRDHNMHENSTPCQIINMIEKLAQRNILNSKSTVLGDSSSQIILNQLVEKQIAEGNIQKPILLGRKRQKQKLNNKKINLETTKPSAFVNPKTEKAESFKEDLILKRFRLNKLEEKFPNYFYCKFKLQLIRTYIMNPQISCLINLLIDYRTKVYHRTEAKCFKASLGKGKIDNSKQRKETKQQRRTVNFDDNHQKLEQLLSEIHYEAIEKMENFINTHKDSSKHLSGKGPLSMKKDMFRSIERWLIEVYRDNCQKQKKSSAANANSNKDQSITPSIQTKNKAILKYYLLKSQLDAYLSERDCALKSYSKLEANNDPSKAVNETMDPKSNNKLIQIETGDVFTVSEVYASYLDILSIPIIPKVASLFSTLGLKEPMESLDYDPSSRLVIQEKTVLNNATQLQKSEIVQLRDEVEKIQEKMQLQSKKDSSFFNDEMIPKLDKMDKQVPKIQRPVGNQDGKKISHKPVKFYGRESKTPESTEPEQSKKKHFPISVVSNFKQMINRSTTAQSKEKKNNQVFIDILDDPCETKKNGFIDSKKHEDTRVEVIDLLSQLDSDPGKPSKKDETSSEDQTSKRDRASKRKGSQGSSRIEPGERCEGMNQKRVKNIIIRELLEKPDPQIVLPKKVQQKVAVYSKAQILSNRKRAEKVQQSENERRFIQHYLELGNVTSCVKKLREEYPATMGDVQKAELNEILGNKIEEALEKVLSLKKPATGEGRSAECKEARRGSAAQTSQELRHFELIKAEEPVSNIQISVENQEFLLRISYKLQRSSLIRKITIQPIDVFKECRVAFLEFILFQFELEEKSLLKWKVSQQNSYRYMLTRRDNIVKKCIQCLKQIVERSNKKREVMRKFNDGKADTAEQSASKENKQQGKAEGQGRTEEWEKTGQMLKQPETFLGFRVQSSERQGQMEGLRRLQGQVDKRKMIESIKRSLRQKELEEEDQKGEGQKGQRTGPSQKNTGDRKNYALNHEKEGSSQNSFCRRGTSSRVQEIKGKIRHEKFSNSELYSQYRQLKDPSASLSRFAELTEDYQQNNAPSDEIRVQNLERDRIAEQDDFEEISYMLSTSPTGKKLIKRQKQARKNIEGKQKPESAPIQEKEKTYGIQKGSKQKEHKQIEHSEPGHKKTNLQQFKRINFPNEESSDIERERGMKGRQLDEQVYCDQVLSEESSRNRSSRKRLAMLLQDYDKLNRGEIGGVSGERQEGEPSKTYICLD